MAKRKRSRRGLGLPRIAHEREGHDRSAMSRSLHHDAQQMIENDDPCGAIERLTRAIAASEVACVQFDQAKDEVNEDGEAGYLRQRDILSICRRRK